MPVLLVQGHTLMVEKTTPKRIAQTGTNGLPCPRKLSDLILAWLTFLFRSPSEMKAAKPTLSNGNIMQVISVI